MSFGWRNTYKAGKKIYKNVMYGRKRNLLPGPSGRYHYGPRRGGLESYLAPVMSVPGVKETVQQLKDTAQAYSVAQTLGYGLDAAYENAASVFNYVQGGGTTAPARS